MLLPNEITVFFQKCVTMFYYGVSGDTTMLVALGSISYYQPKETFIHTPTHVDKTTSEGFFDYTTKNNNQKQIDMH